MEVAGLVLGALPIAISAVENYLKGLQAIDHYKNYPQTLRGISRNIFIQQQQLRVTLDGIGLQDLTLHGVQQRLRIIKPDCADNFIEILNHMDNITARLMNKLDIDSNGKI